MKTFKINFSIFNKKLSAFIEADTEREVKENLIEKIKIDEIKEIENSQADIGLEQLKDMFGIRG